MKIKYPFVSFNISYYDKDGLIQLRLQVAGYVTVRFQLLSSCTTKMGPRRSGDIASYDLLGYVL